MVELVVGSITMFMFKAGSRNQFDNFRKEDIFRKNYYRTFKLKLPSCDAIEDVFRLLNNEELEKLKSIIIKELIQRKIFKKFRFLSKKYMISIDGSGVSSYKTDYCDQCTSKTSKKGVTTYYHYVLEAKLVTSNDMAISIATEWVQNEVGKEYDKQDCEIKAFIRLAAKLKKMYPRLPLVILADGLYPNQTFFKVCKNYGWDFIATFKDGNLPSIHQELELLPKGAWHYNECFQVHNGYSWKHEYSWVNKIEYKGYILSVIKCCETKKKLKSKETEQRIFVHITNIRINSKNSHTISISGRMRWSIENSFDYLKNHGYNLGHKYSRVSFNAFKNYYQCMMIAHIINQLIENSNDFILLLKHDLKCTIKYLWNRLLSFFLEVNIDENEYNCMVRKRQQIRLA